MQLVVHRPPILPYRSVLPPPKFSHSQSTLTLCWTIPWYIQLLPSSLPLLPWMARSCMTDHLVHAWYLLLRTACLDLFFPLRLRPRQSSCASSPPNFYFRRRWRPVKNSHCRLLGASISGGRFFLVFSRKFFPCFTLQMRLINSLAILPLFTERPTTGDEPCSLCLLFFLFNAATPSPLHVIS